MKQLIAEFPENLLESIQIAQNSTLQKDSKKYKNIAFFGMGGSGIGGILVSKWMEDKLTLPFQVIQDYTIPNYIDENTLCIASSYSGNTEETITTMNLALERKATVIGISSGGKLVEICKENNLQYIEVAGGNPPRSALGFSLYLIMNILEVFELVNEKSAAQQIKQASAILSLHQEQMMNEASNIASKIIHFQTRVYSTTEFSGVSIRFQQQLNENAKVLCSHNVIPEMNHNELVGWGTAGNENTVLFLDSGDLNKRNQARLDFTRKVIESKTDKVFSIKAKGNTLIEKSLYYIHLLDWVSYYVSELNKVDIMEIDVINNLKEKLKTI